MTRSYFRQELPRDVAWTELLNDGRLIGVSGGIDDPAGALIHVLDPATGQRFLQQAPEGRVWTWGGFAFSPGGKFAAHAAAPGERSMEREMTCELHRGEIGNGGSVHLLPLEAFTASSPHPSPALSQEDLRYLGRFIDPGSEEGPLLHCNCKATVGSRHVGVVSDGDAVAGTFVYRWHADRAPERPMGDVRLVRIWPDGRIEFWRRASGMARLMGRRGELVISLSDVRANGLLVSDIDGEEIPVAPPPGLADMHAYDINNCGQVVGHVGPEKMLPVCGAMELPAEQFFPFVWDRVRGTRLLPRLRDARSGAAHSINAVGDIVGWSNCTAVLWTALSVLVDLSPFCVDASADPETQWSSALRINDRGQVLVHAGRRMDVEDRERRQYLLTLGAPAA